MTMSWGIELEVSVLELPQSGQASEKLSVTMAETPPLQSARRHQLQPTAGLTGRSTRLNSERALRWNLANVERVIVLRGLDCRQLGRLWLEIALSSSSSRTTC